MKKWTVAELDRNKAKELSQKYGLPSFTSMLLAIRGITEREEIEKFFSEESILSDPFDIKDMDKAVERIKKAVTTGEKICIYGDYDCDGVTSTALLYSYLDSVFANVMYYIPDRNTEGYGMNIKAVDKLKELGVKLIITVDNGISAIEEVKHANEIGIDVVVTDHHKPQDIMPNATAVVNPHRTDDTSEFKDYCGAGIALKLAIALEGDMFSVMENYAEVAAIGTIADLVPLSGENRTIVKAGLKNIRNTERVGLSKLIEIAGIDKVNAGNVAFRLAPRVNASGRLGSAYDALNIFLTEDYDKSVKTAELLDKLNGERQAIEAEIFNDICKKLEEEKRLTYDRVLVISSKGWNPGVIGIVSSKITEKFGKPSIIISEDGEVCKASGRSVTGFSLVDAVFACSEYLEKFGGHPMAVGFSIKQENIDSFRKAINEYANKEEKMPLADIKLDCKLNPEILVPDMVHQLHYFEPFGYGNSKPVFSLNNMHLDRIIPMSEGKHLKLAVSRGKARLNIMKFSTAPSKFPYSEGDVLDFAVCLETNMYQGKEYMSFSIRDIKLSDFDNEKAMYELQDYDSYKSGILLKSLSDKLPTREEFAAVYLYLKKNPKDVYSIDSILQKVNTATINAFKLLMILEIMEEHRLIEYKRELDNLNIRILNVGVKVNLYTSPIYMKLKEDINNVGKHT